MFCPNCGSSVDGKFCTNCGAKMEFQDQVESFVQNEIPQPVFSNQPEASAPETADEPQFTVAAVEPDVEPVYAPPVQTNSVYQPPVQETPAYQVPTQGMPQQNVAPPIYTPPQAPPTTPPPAPKKKSKAGKIVLIVLLSVFGFILLVSLLLWFAVIRPIMKAAKAEYTAPTPTPYVSVFDEPEEEPEEPAVTEEPQETAPATKSVDLSEYNGYIFVYVDNAEYVDDTHVAIDITLENYTNFGIDNIREMIVTLYDQEGYRLTRGGFYFTDSFNEFIPAYGYTTMRLVFDDAAAAGEVEPGLDLTGADTNFELICDMYDENDDYIGMHVETVMFGINIPADCADKMNYDFENVNNNGLVERYYFYNIANEDYGGDVFEIRVYDEYGVWDSSEVYLTSCYNNSYHLTYAKPVGVQHGSSEELTQEYEFLQDHIDEILETIQAF